MCDDEFSYYGANAICRELGYPEALGWFNNRAYSFDGGRRFLDMANTLDIKLDDVQCNTEQHEVDWESCDSNTRHNCGHFEDVLLTCAKGNFFE